MRSGRRCTRPYLADELSRMVKPLLAGVVPMALASKTLSKGRPALVRWMVVAMAAASSSVRTGYARTIRVRFVEVGGA